MKEIYQKHQFRPDVYQWAKETVDSIDSYVLNCPRSICWTPQRLKSIGAQFDVSPKHNEAITDFASRVRDAIYENILMNGLKRAQMLASKNEKKGDATV